MTSWFTLPRPRLVIPAVLALAAVVSGALLPDRAAQAQSAQTVAPGWTCIPKDDSNNPRFTSGESFRLLFVTSPHGATLSNTGIAHYNGFAQTRAATVTCLSGFSGQFRAVVSTQTVDARDNTATTGPGVPIYWLGGGKVADDYADFYDDSWDSVAGKFDNGGNVVAAVAAVATGSDSDGTKHASAYAGASSVRYGGLGSSSYSPLSQTSISRSNVGSWRIYALSPVITVQAAAVSSIAVTSSPPASQSGYYKAGDTIAVTVTFNEAITVVGAPTLKIRVGRGSGSQKTASCAAHSSENTKLVCSYTVMSGDADTNGISVERNTLAVGSGVTIKNSSNTDAKLTYAASLALGAQSAHKVDAVAPDAPRGFSATALVGGTRLSWKAPSPADATIAKYQVRQKAGTAAWGNWQDVAGGAAVRGHTVTGLMSGTAYTFELRAVDTATNVGAASSAGPVTPLAVGTGAPAGQTVPSDWALKPDGLTAGQSFRLLFVTSGSTGATSTDISTYNAFVQEAAGRNGSFAAFSQHFRALVSTATTDTRDNTATTGTGVPIYWVQGAKIADSYADFYDGSWDSGAGKSETGAATTPPYVWTGSAPNGLKSISVSQGVTIGPVGLSRIRVGLVGKVNAISAAYIVSSEARGHLYGLSPVLTVESAAKPVTPPVTTTPPPPTAQTVLANWPLKPGGVSAEQRFRLLFITSTTRNARSSDIADYNRFVQKAANRDVLLRPFKGAFRAVASTSTVDARDNTATTGTGVPIYWAGSTTKVADDYADFYDGSWDSRLGITERGGDVDRSTFIWTGTNKDGTKHKNSLGSKKKVAGGLIGLEGRLLFGATKQSKRLARLYALSPVITVSKPATPTGLTATEGNAQVTLSWTDPNDASITKYQYQQQAGSEAWGSWTDIPTSAPGETNATSYTVPSLTNGTAYQFRLRAVDAAGTVGESDTTASVTPSAVAPPTVTSVEVISQPGNGHTYQYPERIQVKVTFSMPRIKVTWLPTLDLHVGVANDAPIVRVANFARQCGVNQLLFEYLVVADDVDPDGLAIPANALKRHTAKDRIWDPATDRTADLTHAAIAADANHKVNGLYTLRNGSGCYSRNAAERAAAAASMDAGCPTDPATPTLQEIRMWSLPASTSTSTCQQIAYTTEEMTQRRQRLKERLGLGANEPLPAGRDVPTTYGRCTRVRAPDDTYAVGETIRLGAVFASGHVAVHGAPTLKLVVGTTTRQAAYREKRTWTASDRTERTALFFDYTIQADDRDADGISIPANPVETGYAHRIDSAWDRSPAVLTFAGLGAQSGHKVGETSGMGQQAARQVAAPLTARFDGVPPGHKGEGQFGMRLAFSAPVAGRAKTATIHVTGGTLQSARRVNERADLWQLRLTPDSLDAVTVTLPATTDCSARGAICTADGRKLETPLSATVQGPPALRIADARAKEGVDATIDFAVTLSRAALGDVTVRYATRDGTAKKGKDYTKTKGRLTFAPGETRKTIAVPVLDDAHDEGEETFRVMLSGAKGAVTADREAVGTIENDDKLQQAWLARFGRTVGTHVTDAVSERLRGGATDSHLTLGGYRVPLGQKRTGASTPAARARGGSEPALNPKPVEGSKGSARTEEKPFTLSVRRPAPEVEGSQGQGEGAPPPETDQAPGVTAVLTEVARVLGMGPGAESTTNAPWLNGPGPDPRLGRSRTLDLGQTLTLRQILLGSSFRLNLGPSTGLRTGARAGDSSPPRLTAWGRFAGTTFNGQAGALALDGDVFTGTVGVDHAWDRLLAGIAVAHSRGDGSFTDATPGLDNRGRGDLEQTLTSIHPYLRYAVTDRLDVWGLVGYGWGELDLELADGQTMETDTTLVMGAVGGRGMLLAPADTGGFQLATRTDAMFTRTSSDAVADSVATDADAHRVRVILEGSRGITWADGQSLTPTVELGLRHDWGDAETGFGLEVGGRVQYAAPALGLTVDAAVRGLLAHEDADYDEWGAWGTVRVAPGAGGRGLALTLAPAWGVAQSGVEGLWARQTTQGLAPQGQQGPAAGRLTAEVGYGLPAPIGRGVVTPYGGVTLAQGGTQQYRLGGRLALDDGLTLNLEGAHQQPGGQTPADTGLLLQVEWPW